MDVVLVVTGLALVGIVLRDVFNDLLHPGGTSALSDWIGRGLFTMLRRDRGWLPLAGPVTVVTVIGAWVAALVLGFALVYLPAYPRQFQTSTGGMPPGSPRFAPVLYFSFETLVTLGYGDLVPRNGVTRGLATVEALVGFGLLTASVSAVVLLYPALSRIRLLALSVSHVVSAEQKTGVRLAESPSDGVLNGLARDVTHARIDLVHFPVVYYFAAHEPEASLASWTVELSRLAREARAAGRPAHIRAAGAALDDALDGLAAILEQHVPGTAGSDRRRVFRAFAEDHRVESRADPTSGRG
jgi:hypothetical protein